MTYKWIGAVLIIAGCGGAGFSIAANYRQRENILRQMIRILRYMEWELQCRLTLLPQLCRQAAMEVGGPLRHVFLELAERLDSQMESNVRSSMASVLKNHAELPRCVNKQLMQLGNILGRFDLEGQLEGLRAVRSGCKELLKGLSRDSEIRLRSYRTLGLCAGAALAILFI